MTIKRSLQLLSGALLLSGLACSSENTPGSTLGFFVTSDTSMTGNLGGLAGADKRCQDLAAAVGAGNKKWAAYLSAERGGPNGGPVHAKDRIGRGPWLNAKGMMIAATLTDLHNGMAGNAELFLDERGNKVNGSWGRIAMNDPNEHDILTGTNADGTVFVGRTCLDWTSAGPDKGQVGHSDGLGPNMNPMPPYASWNSSHDNMDCSNTAPRGGSGKIYCFATN
jgi:hypothetical protein